jgi:CubicO group peptidase (beta-lactamase class C family)
MILRHLLALPLLALAMPALADPPAGLDAKVEALRKQTGAPGIAVAIVEHGKTVLAKGWGVRKLGDPKGRCRHDLPDRIDRQGVHCRRARHPGRSGQDRLGRQGHRPPAGFQMYDPWVTREMTIRDLLVHRSGLGLGAGDLLFVPRSNLSRAESVKRLRVHQAGDQLPLGYAYDNILYMVAGQLIEEVTGKTWEDFVTAEVLKRGGMNSATATYEARWATPDRAFPHARIGGAVRGDGMNQQLNEREELGRAAAPAGNLALSANDLAQWLKIQLGHGALPGGGRLFSEAQAAEMWKGVTVQPITPYPGSLAPLTPKFSIYGLGWEVEDYRGARIISHGGGVFGSITHIVLLPDQDVGIAVVVNSEDIAASTLPAKEGLGGGCERSEPIEMRGKKKRPGIEPDLFYPPLTPP